MPLKFGEKLSDIFPNGILLFVLMIGFEENVFEKIEKPPLKFLTTEKDREIESEISSILKLDFVEKIYRMRRKCIEY